MSLDRDYEQIKVIGRGNYGTAILVRSKANGVRCVAKKIPLQMLSARERADTVRESKLLQKLNHQNIVEYIDSFEDDGCLYIVTHYCDAGDLAKIIKRAKKAKRGYFDEEQILNWFIQIAMAVDYIHSRKVLHRDLKTGNVFVTGLNVIKLGDFGIAKVLDSTLEQANTVVGTPYYMSPEVCENKAYNYKSDLWAMGCILYELCTLNHAFDASNLLGLVFKIVQESYPPIPDHYSPELKGLVDELLSKDASKRPSCRKIFAKPFIKRRLENLAESVDLAFHDLSPPPPMKPLPSAGASPKSAARSGTRYVHNAGSGVWDESSSSGFGVPSYDGHAADVSASSEETYRNMTNMQTMDISSTAAWSKTLLKKNGEEARGRSESSRERGEFKRGEHSIGTEGGRSVWSAASDWEQQREYASGTPDPEEAAWAQGTRTLIMKPSRNGGDSGRRANESKEDTAKYRTVGRFADLSLDTLKETSRRSSNASERSLDNDSTLMMDQTTSFQPKRTQAPANASTRRLKSHHTADVLRPHITQSPSSAHHKRASSDDRDLGKPPRKGYVLYDERPIRSSGRYNIEEWEVAQTQAQHASISPAAESKVGDARGRNTPSPFLRTGGTSEEDFYSDDWETDDDSSGGPSDARDAGNPPRFIFDRYEDSLTPRGAERAKAANEKDVRQVLGEIRKRAIGERFSQDSPRTPQPLRPNSGSRRSRFSSEGSSTDVKGKSSSQTDRWKSIATRDRQRLQKVFGAGQFEQVYAFLKQAHSQQGLNPKEKKRALERLVGKDNLQYCFEMDQLIFIEDTFLSGPNQ